jgi:hypothetical protein
MWEKLFDRFITPLAILIGSVVIGAAIIVAPQMTPYRFSRDGLVIWRLNAITGQGVMCKPAGGRQQGYSLNCDWAAAIGTSGSAQPPAPSTVVPAGSSEITPPKKIDDETFRKLLDATKPSAQRPPARTDQSR